MRAAGAQIQAVNAPANEKHTLSRTPRGISKPTPNSLMNIYLNM
jgi:hypothetical protein